ncbi:amino acid ABC transporter substrate-binding protein (PAAT family) [Halospina denitrificans]|uniref:Amino acid ABC transporter substrate-binding protein (PAAT family) n=1 Tax=Halospina denitrificans TaxID=332522 RepID=A0A4V3EPV1_9GAMM|nr:transporter substrate-binding domain-containing protein [Halospina denitrificans]TDT38628.1 amino acid ABC transporter substrate-binding protein (PAAT family) [Halospina denitrificans]
MRWNPVKQDRLASLVWSLVVVIGLALSAPAVAARDGGDAEEPIVFSLAAIDPYAREVPGGEPQGVLVEIVKELRSRTGLPLRYHVRPHGRTLLELEEGIADFVPSFATPGVERIGERVGHIATARVLVLGRDGDESINSLAGLNGDNVGYLDGTWYGRAFEKNEKIHKVPVNDVAHGVRLLKRGRLKAVVATEIAIPPGYNPEHTDDSTLKILLELEPNEGKLYMSRRSSRDKASELIAEALKAMHKDGTMDRLLEARFRTISASDGSE